MSVPQDVPRLTLPEHPSLDHLKKQAYNLHRELCARQGDEVPLADAYHELAKRYGFSSWPKLKRHVEYRGNAPLLAVVEAVGRCDVERVRRLLAERPYLLHARQPNSASLLHVVCGGEADGNRRRVEMIETLLDLGLPVDAGMDTGETALHFAATFPDTERPAALLRRGATPDIEAGEPRDGGTPLVHALFHGCTANARMLAARALAPLNLRVAAGLGRIDLLETLWPTPEHLLPEASQARGWYRPHDELPAWSPSNDTDEIKGEAVLYAALNDQADAIAWLIDRGADVNWRAWFNATPLHWASLLGKVAAVDALLGRGAEVDIRDDAYRGYPWGWAAQSGLGSSLIRPLMDRSRCVTLFEAANFGHLELARRLIERNPSLIGRVQDDPPVCGRLRRGTALHEAADHGHTEIARLLLQRGADAGARDAEGRTPLSIALERGHTETSELLRRWGGR